MIYIRMNEHPLQRKWQRSGDAKLMFESMFKTQSEMVKMWKFTYLRIKKKKD